ncbi:MAG: flagellar hook-basal body complex protein FliE [Clostridiaceae bacterium]|nr:flagellar hook-basal body complex protein FliE [Clostridiaceae bacterium]
MKINSSYPFNPINVNQLPVENGSEKNISFSEFLNKAIKYVDEMQKKSANLDALLAAGKVDNLHQVFIESEKASIALQFTIQVRNKIMDAYNEIMRMQI